MQVRAVFLFTIGVGQISKHLQRAPYLHRGSFVLTRSDMGCIKHPPFAFSPTLFHGSRAFERKLRISQMSIAETVIETLVIGKERRWSEIL